MLSTSILIGEFVKCGILIGEFVKRGIRNNNGIMELATFSYNSISLQEAIGITLHYRFPMVAIFLSLNANMHT